MIKIPENLILKLKSPKTLMILGITGILLIFLSTFFGGEKQDETEKNIREMSVEEYRIGLQDDIKEMVTSITGSRKVTVVVTLESGIRYSYADTREETVSGKTESDSESKGSELKESYITVKSPEGGEEALLLTTEMPEIRGVAVVCDGGDNEILSEKIKNTVTAALNITSKRVYICGRKQ